MGLNIKNENVHRLAKQLARETGETMTSVIEQALEEARGRVSGPAGAAARLGVPASTLESKIKRFNIDKLRFRAMRREAPA